MNYIYVIYVIEYQYHQIKVTRHLESPKVIHSNQRDKCCVKGIQKLYKVGSRSDKAVPNDRLRSANLMNN